MSAGAESWNNKEIASCLAALTGKGNDAEYAAIGRLRVIAGEEVPMLLAEHYHRAKHRGTRCSCLFFSFRAAKTSEHAKRLALAAVLDKSKAVRYRACQLLAYAQDRKLLPAMEQLSKQVAADSIEDLNAALDAVANQNQHWFLDRTHSGKVFMNMFGMSD